MAISDSVDRLVTSAFETYFQLLEKPLPGYMRFLYAELGSLSLFLAAILVLDMEPDTGILALVKIDITFTLVIFSVLFGLLVSLARTKHGPVRLYISGVLLPAFVISVIRATWSIDIVKDIGSTG